MVRTFAMSASPGKKIIHRNFCHMTRGFSITHYAGTYATSTVFAIWWTTQNYHVSPIRDDMGPPNKQNDTCPAVIRCLRDLTFKRHFPSWSFLDKSLEATLMDAPSFENYRKMVSLPPKSGWNVARNSPVFCLPQNIIKRKEITKKKKEKKK